MALGIRGIAFFALSFVSFILVIVGTPLKMAEVKTTIDPYPINIPAGIFGRLEVHNRYTMWKICEKRKLTRGSAVLLDQDPCRTDFTCANDIARNARAFAIMSIIVLALGSSVVGALDMLCKLPADPKGKIILIAFGAISVAFTIITWASQVALYRDDCTGQSVEDAPGHKIGPSAILIIIASGFMIIATVLAAVLPGPVQEVETVSGEAKVAHPDNVVDAVPSNQPTDFEHVDVAKEPAVVHKTNEPVA